MNQLFRRERAMLDDTMTRRRIGDLEQALKRERAEARKVSIQLLVASLNPLSNARAGLKARHAALVKLADETAAEIERRRLPRGGMPAS
jgi:hypothetical protein